MASKLRQLRLSELLAIGVKWVNLDQTSTVIFNDGTRMTGYWSQEGSEYTDMSEHNFRCWRDTEMFDVLDDVRKTLDVRYDENPPMRVDTAFNYEFDEGEVR